MVFNIWLYIFTFGFILYWVSVINLFCMILSAVKKETESIGILKLKEKIKEQNIIVFSIKMIFTILLSFGLFSLIPIFNFICGMAFLESDFSEDVKEYALDYIDRNGRFLD